MDKLYNKMVLLTTVALNIFQAALQDSDNRTAAGAAFELKNGEKLRVVDLEGGQAADLLAWLFWEK